jgi:hypothetical protein
MAATLKYIELNHGEKAIIDAEDYPLVKDYKWRFNGRYAETGSKAMYMHRLILDVKEPWPKVHTDHINGNGLDNRKSNLRVVTPAQNQHNSKKRIDNTTGYKGVSKRRGGGYRAYLFIKGKQIYLGGAKTAEQAAKIYDEGIKKHYGEYGRGNHA